MSEALFGGIGEGVELIPGVVAQRVAPRNVKGPGRIEISNPDNAFALPRDRRATRGVEVDAIRVTEAFGSVAHLLDSLTMVTHYNRIAGQSVERLAALSDGIFAVAMTLLVLDLRVPAKEAIHSGVELGHALQALAPQLVAYMMSFMTLGIFWIGQQTQLNYLERTDRSLSWIHILFLFGVSVMPFSTRLLAEFIEYRTVLIVYWLNILLLGAVLYLSWTCASRMGLVKADMPVEVPRAIKRRIVIAQSLYAFGALLCLRSTYWSIAFIVLVQLNYAIAPRWPGRRRA